MDRGRLSGVGLRAALLCVSWLCCRAAPRVPKWPVARLPLIIVDAETIPGWHKALQIHLRSSWPIVIPAALGESFTADEPELMATMTDVVHPYEAQGASFIQTVMPEKQKAALMKATAKSQMLAPLGLEYTGVWGTTPRFAQNVVHTDKGDERCTFSTTLQIQGTKRWYLAMPFMVREDGGQSLEPEKERINKEHAALKELAKGCSADKERHKDRPGPCADFKFVSELFYPAIPKGAVFETTLYPGDMLFFASQFPHGALSAEEDNSSRIDFSYNGLAANLKLPPEFQGICASSPYKEEL